MNDAADADIFLTLGDEHDGGTRLGLNSFAASHASLQAIDWQSINRNIPTQIIHFNNFTTFHLSDLKFYAISKIKLFFLGKWHIRFRFIIKVTTGRASQKKQSSHSSSQHIFKPHATQTELIWLILRIYLHDHRLFHAFLSFNLTF